MARLKSPESGRFIDQGKNTLRARQRAIANARVNKTIRQTRIQKGKPETMDKRLLASAWHFAHRKYLEHKALADHYLARTHALTARMEKEGLTLNAHAATPPEET